MTRTPAYWCTYERDDNDTLFVSCPDFPEVVTYGEDVQRASLNALGAIEEAIAARISDGRKIPETDPHARDPSEDGFWVKLPQLTAQKVILYQLLPELGVTRAELARQLKWHREQVDRLFRLDHASQSSQLDAAFRVLGREVDVEVRQIGPISPARQ